MLQLPLAENQLAIRRAAARLCTAFGWAVLRGDGGFNCIEVKSGPRDFLTDSKWPDYRAFCDALYFAVDDLFPHELIPHDVGLIVACTSAIGEPAMIRDAVPHPMAPARRRALLHQFAALAANRLAARVGPPAVELVVVDFRRGLADLGELDLPCRHITRMPQLEQAMTELRELAGGRLERHVGDRR